MTDPTPTPADLERAREWLEEHGYDLSAALDDARLYRESREEAVSMLAALLRSVREEGAWQERERCVGICSGRAQDWSKRAEWARSVRLEYELEDCLLVFGTIKALEKAITTDPTP